MISTTWCPKVIQVIETWEPRGRGTINDPARLIRTYWTFEGEYLGEAKDPHEPENCQAPNEG